MTEQQYRMLRKLAIIIRIQLPFHYLVLGESKQWKNRKFKHKLKIKVNAMGIHAKSVANASLIFKIVIPQIM